MTDKEKEFEDGVYAAAMEAAKPSYSGKYDSLVADMYDKIANREKFSYDVSTDPLYQSHKDKYVQQGKSAMRDTMGQAAALTGGYGSTYAQSVGQQSYDAYLQKLTDVIPELYGMAYTRYQDEGDAMQKQYQMLGQQRDAEYGRFRDDMSDWQSERAFQTQQQSDAYANLYALILASGYTPTDKELAAAGIGREQADALRQTWAAKNPNAAWQSGALSADDYYKLTGQYPAGYNAPAAQPQYLYYGGSSGSGSSGKDKSTNTISKNGNGSIPSSFETQRDMDAYLKAEVSKGNLTMAEATDLRDTYSRRLVGGGTNKNMTR